MNLPNRWTAQGEDFSSAGFSLPMGIEDHEGGPFVKRRLYLEKVNAFAALRLVRLSRGNSVFTGFGRQKSSGAARLRSALGRLAVVEIGDLCSQSEHFLTILRR